MQEILEKIYPYDKDKLTNEILNLYEKQKFAISNFIYFAIIKQQKLFENTKKTTIQKEYKKALLKGDFLLPDGIALQIFYYLASNQFDLQTDHLSNLNGTDYIPYFLDEIKKRFGSNRIQVYLYGAKPEIVEQTKKRLELKGFNIKYIQDGYSELERDKIQNKDNEDENTIKVLLVARSTPTNPIQELWTQKNHSKIKENHFIVFTVGGLFDFIAAEGNGNKKGTQKRAPKFIRKIKLERLWRFITDPKRNYIKVKNSFSLFPYILKYLVLKKQ